MSVNEIENELIEEFSIPAQVSSKDFIYYLQNSDAGGNGLTSHEYLLEHKFHPNEWGEYDLLIRFSASFSGNTYQLFSVEYIKDIDIKKIKIEYQYDSLDWMPLILDTEECLHETMEYIHSIIYTYWFWEFWNQHKMKDMRIPLIGRVISNVKNSFFYKAYLTNEFEITNAIKSIMELKHSKYLTWFNAHLSNEQIEVIADQIEVFSSDLEKRYKGIRGYE
jgi:hypothetical protein